MSHYRPEFLGHENDWPNDRPTDIIDRERVEQIQNGAFDWTEIENVIPKNKQAESIDFLRSDKMYNIIGIKGGFSLK